MSSNVGSTVLDVVYVILGLTPFILLCIRRACTKWDRKNDQVYEALRSPSVREARNAFDRRVALALREAKQGSQLCRGCEFSNSMRVTSCVLCGATLPVQKRTFLFKKTKVQDGDSELAPVEPSRRQWQIRRRKEWMRKVDGTGRIIWAHDSQLSGAELEFPAYVLKTEFSVLGVAQDSITFNNGSASVSSPQSRRRDGSVAAALSDHIEIVVDNDTAEPEPESPPQVTIEAITRSLKEELAKTTVQVVNSTNSDPARVAFTPIDTSPCSAQAIADTVRNAQLDFPPKLAQFIMSMATVFNESKRSRDTNERVITRFEINRSSLLSESMAAIATLSTQEARSAIRVDFVDEQGIDAGGVYREWFLLLNEEIVKQDAGIFFCVDEHEQTFYLNPLSHEILGDNHLSHFFAAGRLLGRALLDGNVTGFHLATPLLKIILGLPVGFSDLEYFDPDAFKNLKWLLDNDGVDILGLNFTAVKKMPNGRVEVVELVHGGSEIDVTDDNKHEFIDRKLQYLLFESVQDQLFAFLKGLYDVVPVEMLMLFDTVELDYILSGSDEIDVDDWEAHTVTSPNINLHPAYFNFWKIVRELSSDEQRRLLQYATGSTRVPPGGFSALTSHDGRLCLFTLQGVIADTTWGCIHAHACFNRLDVPLFREAQPLREAIRAAVASESVGFTTM